MPGFARAEDSMTAPSAPAPVINATATTTAAIEQPLAIANKICPVSGEKIKAGEMGEMVTKEYNGKMVNLCCKMCIKDFDKNPAKFTKIAEDEVNKEEANKATN